MEDSILDSIKKLLNVDVDYDAFDMDIMIHINSVFFTLNQLAVGPTSTFKITGRTEKWADFNLGSNDYEAVKTYVYLKVRLVFDPPATSFTIDAFKKQAEEYEWRLNIQAETSNIL